MKRILSIAVVFGLILIQAPLALSQNPKNKGKEKEDEQTQPGTRGNQPRSTPKPQSTPRPQPQPQPQPRSLPQPPQEDPRARIQGKPSGSTQQPGNQGKSTGQQPGNPGKSTSQPPQNDGRRFSPPQPQNNPPQPTGRELPKNGGQLPKNTGPEVPRNTGRELPKSSGQPEQLQGSPKHSPGPITQKPEINAPRRGEGSPKGVDGGKATLPGGGVTPPARGPEEARRRPGQISPTGKPRVDNPVPSAKETVLTPDEGGKATNDGSSLPGRKQLLGRPSQPNPKGGRGNEAASIATTPNPNNVNATTGKGNIPATASTNVKRVDAPSRMRKLPMRDPNSGEDVARVKPTYEKTPKIKRPVSQVTPIAAPEGGRVYRGNDYHHEYSHHHRSSWALGIGISDGSTSLAFGYSSGPAWGHSYGFAAASYWHPHCYAPVVYHQPCYAVAYPVYYSPIYYETAIVDPWAYNSSSFAFGFSSYGGSAISSFSFAYSSSNWGVGFGWNSAPAYAIYTPVYDPYFRSVWVPGYYQIADERAWVPGSYDEVVSTPVVEEVVDPLGNSYDAVVQPGSVDYVWKDGYWTLESRRIWVPGHFEYVAAF